MTYAILRILRYRAGTPAPRSEIFFRTIVVSIPRLILANFCLACFIEPRIGAAMNHLGTTFALASGEIVKSASGRARSL
jgi:hypothetical protein